MSPVTIMVQNFEGTNKVQIPLNLNVLGLIGFIILMLQYGAYSTYVVPINKHLIRILNLAVVLPNNAWDM